MEQGHQDQPGHQHAAHAPPGGERAGQGTAHHLPPGYPRLAGASSLLCFYCYRGTACTRLLNGKRFCTPLQILCRGSRPLICQSHLQTHMPPSPAKPTPPGLRLPRQRLLRHACAHPGGGAAPVWRTYRPGPCQRPAGVCGRCVKKQVAVVGGAGVSLSVRRLTCGMVCGRVTQWRWTGRGRMGGLGAARRQGGPPGDGLPFRAPVFAPASLQLTRLVPLLLLLTLLLLLLLPSHRPGRPPPATGQPVRQGAQVLLGRAGRTGGDQPLGRQGEMGQGLVVVVVVVALVDTEWFESCLSWGRRATEFLQTVCRYSPLLIAPQPVTTRASGTGVWRSSGPLPRPLMLLPRAVMPRRPQVFINPPSGVTGKEAVQVSARVGPLHHCAPPLPSVLFRIHFHMPILYTCMHPVDSACLELHPRNDAPAVPMCSHAYEFVMNVTPTGLLLN